MINQSTIDTLRQMRMGAMAQALEEQLLDQETYEQVGFEDRLGRLADAKWSKLQSSKLNRYTKNAQFANPEACV